MTYIELCDWSNSSIDNYFTLNYVYRIGSRLIVDAYEINRQSANNESSRQLSVKIYLERSRNWREGVGASKAKFIEIKKSFTQVHSWTLKDLFLCKGTDNQL